MRYLSLLMLLVCRSAHAQVSQFPYVENFDSVTPPALPPGWTTTTNRSASGDFTTSTTSPQSPPNAVVSTNAWISQSLISPVFDFTGRMVDSVVFYERRSNTDTTGLLVEASTDGGASFSIQISDTLELQSPGTYVRRAFPLPSVLSARDTVKFRWRVLGDSRGGTTATTRFDNIRITVRTQFDVGVSSISVVPAYPTIGDSAILAARVNNYGMQSVQNFLVEFYNDANRDSLPQPTELFDSARISSPLAAGDSVDVQSILRNLALGDNQIIVETNLPNDENRANDRRIRTVSVGVRPFSVVVNEIMYGPTSPEPEWIELYNVSADSVNLRNWKISNRNSSTRYTISSVDVITRRDQYVVITKDTALLFAVHPRVASTVIQSSAMPTFLFNNNGDAVVTFDPRGVMMDSVHYAPAWGGTNGKSLERVDAFSGSNDSTNWISSQDSIGSTPGRENSTTPVAFDLRALRIAATPAGAGFVVRVVILNVGREAASGFAASLFRDANGDSLAQSSELLGRQPFVGALQPRDSIIFAFTWGDPGFGRTMLIAEAEFSADLRPANNVVFGIVSVSYFPRVLVINEIMYEPLSGQAEYVELYNRNQGPVDLRDWKISDLRDATGRANEHLLTHGRHLVQPGDNVVLASDSTLFQRFNLASDTASGIHVFIVNKSSLSLNNEGDDVVLTDLTGTAIDSLRYSPQWHNAHIADVSGRALERVNPELPATDRRNWSTSVHFLGGTPGRQNSIFTASVPTSTALSFAPNPFSPDGDGYQDFTMISYELPSAAAVLRIRIYDARGRLVRTLANGEPTGARGNIIWDGMNDDRQKVRMGIHIVLLEALDANGSTIYSTKGVVVVAVKL